MLTRALLFCGIASSLWYALINLIVPHFYPGYRMLDLTISELSAIGAPTRGMWVILVIPYVSLFAAFGWGVLRSASNRWLRITGYLILAYSAFNLYWPPMHTREALSGGGGTLTDTLHLVWAGITVALFIAMMIITSKGMGQGFRQFTTVSLTLLMTFGFLTAIAAPKVAANLPTPNAGLYERIDIAVFLVWIATLALFLLRQRSFGLRPGTPGSIARMPAAQKPEVMQRPRV